MVVFSAGDIFGYLALVLVSLSALLMVRKNALIRKRLLIGPLNPRRHLRRRLVRGRLLYLTNLVLVRRAHMFMALLGGLFLVLHVVYLVTYPLNDAIILGYVAVVAAAFLGLTGVSYLQRFREARYYHGSISLSAIALMTVHAVGSGFNLPVWMATATLLLTAVVVFAVAARHAGKMFA
jgi:hypothetical protein